MSAKQINQPSLFNSLPVIEEECRSIKLPEHLSEVMAREWKETGRCTDTKVMDHVLSQIGFLSEIPEIQGEALRAKIAKAIENAGIEDVVFDPEITAEVLKSQLE